LQLAKESFLRKNTGQFFAIIGLLSSALLSSAHGAEEPSTQTLLFHAIDERLGYMEDVALFKAQNHVPIEDIQRERIVLSDSRELAALHGIEPQTMNGFFQAQINAAKAIQYRYRAYLLTAVMPQEAVDLSTEIRPALDRLGEDIVVLFAELLQDPSALHEGSRSSFKKALNRRFLDDAEKDALFNAMMEVRRI